VFFFWWGGLKPPLGPFFRSLRFRFLMSLCSSPLGPYKSQHCSHIGLLCIPQMIHEGDCGVIGGANDDCRGNRRTQRKPAQRHFVSPQIPHDQVRFRTPDRSGGKPATNCLSYGAAIRNVLPAIKISADVWQTQQHIVPSCSKLLFLGPSRSTIS
jgi:hypothetical protein